jgi:methane/ammonia monooxygenase subunit A
VAISARTPEEAAQLKALLNKKYRYFDYKWDLVFWVTALPIVAAAADITKLLFAGDWDFWTDWKDRQWWVTLTPFAMIIIPSAIQYIQWLAWRFPTGFTYTAVGLWLVSWLGRWLQWDVFVNYPLNFVWPATIVPAAIITDWILLKTRSFVITSVVGGMAFSIAFWAANYVTLAPFLQPVQFMGNVLTLADVQGVNYLRSATPEYLRMIEHGTLRSFLEETQLVSILFGGTVATAGYWVGQGIARVLAIWPIGKFMKKV